MSNFASPETIESVRPFLSRIKLISYTCSRFQAPLLLQQLDATLQTPDDSTATWLLQLLQHQAWPDPEGEGRAASFLLLARWTRKAAVLQGKASGGLTSKVATEAAALAMQTARTRGLTSRVGAAALAFLGTYCASIGETGNLDAVLECMGGVMLSHAGPLPLPCGELSASGVFAALPALAANSDAGCWLFTSLLHCIECLAPAPPYLAIGALSAFYPGIRSFAVAMLSPAGRFQPQPPNGNLPQLLQDLYGTLRAVLGGGGCLAVQSAAALAAGGLLEGLVRAGSGVSSLQPLLQGTAQLIHTAAGCNDSLVQAACALAIAQSHQACRLPHASPATTTCLVSALFGTVLTADVLACSAVAQGGGAQGTAEILQYAQCGLVQQAGALCAAATWHVSTAGLNYAALGEVLNIMMASARRVHEQYKQYTVLQPPTPELDLRPLGTVMAKLFAAHMELLAAVSALPGRQQITHAALWGAVLRIAGDLQFCRTATPLYAQLLKSAMQALPHLPALAVEVAEALPLVAALEAPSPGHGGTATWLIDGVSAAKVQLIFAALTPCCGALPQVSKASTMPCTSNTPWCRVKIAKCFKLNVRV